MRRRDSYNSPPPLRGRSIRKADREGGCLYSSAIQLPPSLSLPHQACTRARASAARVGGGDKLCLCRRSFLTVIAGAALAHSLTARAQQAAMPIVGFINGASAQTYARPLAAFLQGLGEAGYADGRNVAIEYHWAEGHFDRMPEIVAELIRQRVSVIAATSTPAALAAKAAATTIPVVFEMGADPVKLGVVASLSRPGGNVTGTTQLTQDTAPKLLELLHELLPAARVIALLVNPNDPAVAEVNTKAVRAAANGLGLELQIVAASSEGDFEGVFAKLNELRVGALVISAEELFTSHSEQLAALATRNRIPAVYKGREFAAAGGLISYGSDIAEAYRLAGVYTGRVLKGEKPADLPVLQATKIELYINLKTAKALGISVPLPLSGRADELFE
jgi:putative ABC transport system substrate-binding protein